MLKEKLDILCMTLLGVIKKIIFFKDKVEVLISWIVRYLSKNPKSVYQRSLLKLNEAKSPLFWGETK